MLILNEKTVISHFFSPLVNQILKDLLASVGKMDFETESVDPQSLLGIKVNFSTVVSKKVSGLHSLLI